MCRTDLIYDIFQYLYRLQLLYVTVCFVWVPCHVTIEGKEMAERLAKELRKDIDLVVPLGRNVLSQDNNNNLKKKL